MNEQTYSLKIIDQIRNSGYRPQAVGCFINQKKLLFLYKAQHKLWQLPQGGIENKETIEDATWREMTEELGDDFIKQCQVNLSIIGQDKIEFPKSKQNLRNLSDDSGNKIAMKGKHYFFVVIKTNEDAINLTQTEFDDYQWLNLKEATKISKEIYQKGKQRITNNALELLQTTKYL